MRRVTVGTIAVGLVAALLTWANPAGAGVTGPIWTVTDSPEGYVDEVVIELENTNSENYSCDEGTTEVNLVDPDSEELLGGPVPLSGDDEGSFTVPDDLAQTIFELEVFCEVEGDEFFRHPDFVGDYAAIDVTKVVEGDPAGAGFVVNVACETEGEQDDAGPYDLEFGPTGGTDRVWVTFEHDCEVTETDDGGATSTTVAADGPEDCGAEVDGDVATFAIRNPELCEATFTNVFPDAEEPTTPTTDAVGGTGAQPAPAPAATPVRAQPTFTG